MYIYKEVELIFGSTFGLTLNRPERWIKIWIKVCNFRINCNIKHGKNKSLLNINNIQAFILLINNFVIRMFVYFVEIQG